MPIDKTSALIGGVFYRFELFAIRGERLPKLIVGDAVQLVKNIR
jgi:hypothetical protein